MKILTFLLKVIQRLINIGLNLILGVLIFATIWPALGCFIIWFLACFVMHPKETIKTIKTGSSVIGLNLKNKNKK